MNLKPTHFDPAPFAACIESIRDVQMRDLLPKIRRIETPSQYGNVWRREDTDRCVTLKNLGWTYREISDLVGRTPLAIQQRIGHLV